MDAARVWISSLRLPQRQHLGTQRSPDASRVAKIIARNAVVRDVRFLLDHVVSLRGAFSAALCGEFLWRYCGRVFLLLLSSSRSTSLPSSQHLVSRSHPTSQHSPSIARREFRSDEPVLGSSVWDSVSKRRLQAWKSEPPTVLTIANRPRSRTEPNKTARCISFPKSIRVVRLASQQTLNSSWQDQASGDRSRPSGQPSIYPLPTKG